MKSILILILSLFVSCSSQVLENSKKIQTQDVMFEDLYHYKYSLTDKAFLVIDSQQKMDDAFKIIHQKSPKGRMVPIPTIYENAEETYIVFKPKLENENDVEILKINYKKGNLCIDVKPAYNVEFTKNNKIQPNILIKILKKLNINKVIINYK